MPESFDEKLARVTGTIRRINFSNVHERYRDGLLYYYNKAERLHDGAIIIENSFGSLHDAFTLLVQ
jgi:hypothetical protein